ncbi:spore cortex-lytic enzyme [Fredinandcohnia quinoae]|uniref:Spore cortex-lytic enzyme n=1 Tax=Fredinandcohnia quinoae TaxID=2918902 RepID=A0AAW5E0G8_9BACI|nr:spore cortex-lytic enzyme [Fredinandcohnia sp. SECRCQ15]MCH1624770.1 spore cortex-lytic enzyme [Fredinandcohnia sp. SECRCQ15]
MNIRKMVMFPVLLILFSSIIFGVSDNSNVNAFTGQVIQKGATGDDVIELQSRLQYNGYYHGIIDGVYGWSTYWAVRNFQKAFGLEAVDGLVGEKTKEMLLRATKYNKQFVYDNLKKGNRFTHYGGVQWEIQTAPSKANIEKAKISAEERKNEIEKKLIIPEQTQNQQAQNNQQQQNEKQTNNLQQKKSPEKEQNQQLKERNQKKQELDSQKNTEKQQKQPVKEPTAKIQEKQTKPKKQGPAAVNMPGGFSQNDIKLLANAVYGEARGEPYIGQVAIAAVILNRINSPSFPNTVSGVVFEPLAFTAVADGQIWLTPNEKAEKAVVDALNGWDPTGGATYYFNPATATSKWIWGRPQIKRIGKHIFCR